MSDGIENQITSLWGAFGLLATAVGAAFVFLWRHIEGGMGDLWSKLNRQTDASADHQLEVVKTYATKADLHELRAHVDQRLDRLQASVLDAITNRKPPRQS